MPTMDECRRKAEECLHWADEAANDRQRETLLEIARLWTQMELSSAGPKWSGRGCSSLEIFGAAKVIARPQGAKGRLGPGSSQITPTHPEGFEARHLAADRR